MKKITYTLLMVAIVCGLSLNFTSCKDDDKDETGDDGQEQLSEEQQEQNNAAYAILDNLADLSSANDNFLTQTFEPTIGTADDGDASTRIVNTNDMETAAMRFADLVGGADINENTDSYTWADDELGTMVYTKTNDGKSWATVDVNIKQVPHLQKIIFRSPEQADNNGKFEGTAYYRFGDVVKKANADGAEEYWICVRPAFGLEGKDKSHWVTISPLPKKNVWTYKGSNGIDYALPTGLGDNHEHSQNFAEMLFAICFPEQWESNINSYTVPMFHDFDKDNVIYHNRCFWECVQKAWTAVHEKSKGFSLISAVFDLEIDQMQTMLKSADGLNLLTNGFSWWTKSSNKPTLYRYRFVNGTGKESNMHKEPLKKDVFKNYSSVSAEVIKANIKLNCLEDYVEGNLGWVESDFFATSNKHYIIRHATGAELATNKKENPKEPLTGVDEVYRYNKYYNITNLDDAPEITEKLGMDDGNPVSDANLKVGYYIAADGKFYKTMKSCKAHGGAKALVIYLGGKNRVEDNQNWNGLAISLKKEKTIMNDYAYSNCSCTGMEEYKSKAEALNAFNGIAFTDKMKNCDLEFHKHKKIINVLSSLAEIKSSQYQMSNWFVPSLGQFLLAVKGLGGRYNADTEVFELQVINDVYFDVMLTILANEEIMTTTFGEDGEYYGFSLKDGIPMISADKKRTLVPFIAFQYNGGGIQNQ